MNIQDDVLTRRRIDEAAVNIARPLTMKVPLVRAIGEVGYTGCQVAKAEARLVGDDGKFYAHASTTCLMFERPKS